MRMGKKTRGIIELKQNQKFSQRLLYTHARPNVQTAMPLKADSLSDQPNPGGVAKAWSFAIRETRQDSAESHQSALLAWRLNARGRSHGLLTRVTSCHIERRASTYCG